MMMVMMMIMSMVRADKKRLVVRTRDMQARVLVSFYRIVQGKRHLPPRSLRRSRDLERLIARLCAVWKIS